MEHQNRTFCIKTLVSPHSNKQPAAKRRRKTYIKELPPPNPPTSLDQNNGHLQHHGGKAVAAQFLSDAAHDEFVRERRDEEGDARRERAAHVAARGAVHVAPKEIVHGDVPFAAELEPVAAVPPVGVEVAVGEAWEGRD
jgi:hypothetical protein